ncbi:MAG: hypothetical protein KQI35_05255 [Bacteroidetes bacterium]|nr:hypothetical protein [Bacteroidota bacterium]
MKTKFLKIISVLFIIIWPVLLQSQTINTTTVTQSICPGDIVVPINVTNCNGVGAISLVLQFNTSALTFSNYENLHPQLSSGFLIVNNPGDKVIISWANTTAANIGDGKLMDLRFSGVTGNSNLTWDTQTSGNCEYSDVNGNILPSSFTNGTVTVYQMPFITSQPQDKAVLEYQNAIFNVGAIATGIQYQWYGSYNGGSSWIELNNGSLYGGVTSANLTVYNTQLTYDGYLYRCEISGACSPVEVSDAAELSIVEPLITSFDVQQVCPGSITIPILASNFNNVAAFSLAFNFNASALNYTGYQELNALLPPGNFVCNSVNDKVYLSWSSTTPVTFTLPDTAIVEIVFTGYTGSSNLTWDTETAGNCEYTYLNGDDVISVFQNTSFTIYQQPQINVHPVDKLIPENTNTSFSVSAIASGITYQWQFSANDGGDWTDLSNNGTYSGVTATTLNITNASLGMNGFWYRCRVSGFCSPEVFSNPGELIVLPKITAIAPTVSNCPGQVTIPIDVTHFIDVASFSLSLGYNESVLTYEGFQGLNTNLSGGNFAMNAAGGKVFLTWTSTSPVTIGDDQLIEILFSGVTGTSPLAWDIQKPGNCEFSTLEGLVIFSSYTNGNVTVYQPPEITGHPDNKTAPAATSTSFSVTATGTGLSYLWQESTDNGSNWTNLANGGSYSGVTTANLTINPVLWSMDLNQYRCRVSGTCSPVVFSDAVLLDVIPEVISTNAGSVSNSCTGNITVPVLVSNCSNVGAISLALNYDPAKLTFEGYASPHTELTGGMLIVNTTGSEVFLSWASTNPANIGSGILVEFNFKAVAGSSTTVSWDTQIPGNCEYSSPDGFIYVTSFGNGSISIASNALVVDAGTDESINPGGSVQLDGSASGGVTPYAIQWTPDTWLSDASIFNPIANPPITTEYTLTVMDDNGCAGSNRIVVSVAAGGIDLNLKAYLEGPFNTSDMNTDLNIFNAIPLAQPYSGSPWNYGGTESVVAIPNANVVDWILVELRETTGGAATATTGTRLAMKAGFLLKNGTIVGIDGNSMLHFDVSITQNLFVVLWHRNHLAVISSGPLTNAGTTYSWDFSDDVSKVYGTNALTDLGNGFYGLYAGDGNSNGIIQNTDETNVWKVELNQSGYRNGDFNMNGIVQNTDETNYWKVNLNKASQVPN